MHQWCCVQAGHSMHRALIKSCHAVLCLDLCQPGINSTRCSMYRAMDNASNIIKVLLLCDCLFVAWMRTHEWPDSWLQQQCQQAGSTVV